MGGANGLIVAFVVAVWAAYFVPLVLRRYDDATTSSSLESLSPLSRVVSRTRRPAEESAVEDADDTDEHGTAEDPVQALDREALARIEKPAPAAGQRPRVTGKAAALAARRRRRTLLTLLTALVLVGGLAVFSVVPPVWVAAPAGLVVAWLVACRVQVRGERGLSRPSARSVSWPSWLRRPSLSRPSADRAAKPQREASGDDRTAAHDEDTVIVQLDDVDPQRRHVMEQVALTEDALDDQVVIAVPSVSTSGEALWDPLPVTLPTYVTKPRAGRTVRTIDFDAPGAWTSGHIEGEDVELPGRDSASGQTRRASGE